ncbi:acyl carrier protein [Streptomyces sp. CB01201]|uniref:phosphopantetheine-binding protein n=1 Tax=Streptomyces sp. CB01201 TaxID=2020324 RepID=UPI000C26E8D5|nr:acyl carrier protein [Streptomyces sp. CB01201]PJM98522.1 acyl carrier protein [Streptomyces sp. CB01201]
MIGEELQTVIRNQAPDLSEGRPLTADDKLLDLGIDSLGLVELIINIEESFSIVIPDEDMLADNFTSVGTVADLVERIKATSR